MPSDAEYRRDRDEILQHIRGGFLPILEATSEAWEEAKEDAYVVDRNEPQRVFCRGFVAGMEYQKTIKERS